MPSLIDSITDAVTQTGASLLGLLTAAGIIAIIALSISASISDDQTKQRNLRSAVKVLAAIVIGFAATTLVTWVKGFGA